MTDEQNVRKIRYFIRRLPALQEKVTQFVCMIYVSLYGWMMDACL